VRIGSPLFSTTLFPVYVALLIWGGLTSARTGLRALILCEPSEGGGDHEIHDHCEGHKETEAGVMPHEQMFAEMAKYHEELQKAGVLLDASGLQASAKGWRIKILRTKRTLVDGPSRRRRS